MSKGRARFGSGGSKLHMKTLIFIMGMTFIIYNMSKKYKEMILKKENKMLSVIVFVIMILYIDDYFKNQESQKI